MILFVLTCHLIACIWIFIGKRSIFENIEIATGNPPTIGNINWLLKASLD
jgi:hypothetical protein